MQCFSPTATYHDRNSHQPLEYSADGVSLMSVP